MSSAGGSSVSGWACWAIRFPDLSLRLCASSRASGWRSKSDNRSLTDVVLQILWCDYRLWRADISVLSQVVILSVYEKKNGTDEIWCSCSPGIPISLYRVLSPWLTKEIIFVCTVFLSFTLWMTCERTLIHARSTSWIAPQNLQFTLWNSRLWDECLWDNGKIQEVPTL